MSVAADRLEVFPPQGARELASFKVIGEPKPAGSKNAVPMGRRVDGVFVPHTRPDGAPMIAVKDSSGVAGENWRSDIRAACARALDVAHEIHDGPMAVRVVFSRPRNATDFGRDGLKGSAPALPHKSKLADGTKLARALEDALNKLLWTDDRRVCDLWWSRRYGPAGATVTVFALPVRVADWPERFDIGGSDGYHESHDPDAQQALTF